MSEAADMPAAEGGPAASPGQADDRRGCIVDAFLGRLATTPFGDIELSDVSRDAGIGLADLRRDFDGRFAILAEHMRRTDAAVLERDDPAMAGEPARDRLFDVLMRRLDIIAPHRMAVSMLSKSVRRDPMLAAALNPLVVRSMAFMLAAAGLPAAGTAGRLRAQGLAIAWARILPVWVEDEDPGLARTMVAVDRAIARGERVEGFACRLKAAVCRVDGRMRGRRRTRPADGDETVAAGGGI